MWLPTHCGSLLFAEHSPGLKDPMHNRNSLVEGNQVIRYWYHYYTSLCNVLQSSGYCWRSYHRIKYCLESFEAVIANPVHCGGYTKKTQNIQVQNYTHFTYCNDMWNQQGLRMSQSAVLWPKTVRSSTNPWHAGCLRDEGVSMVSEHHLCSISSILQGMFASSWSKGANGWRYMVTNR